LTPATAEPAHETAFSRKVFPVYPGSLLIGENAQNEIKLPSQFVGGAASYRQAELQRDGAWSVETHYRTTREFTGRTV
jgi:hypothetical protein